MKKSLTTVTLLFMTWLGFSQTFTGAKFFTGTNSNYIEDIVADPSGNLYCAGYFFDQVNFGITSFTAPVGNAGSFVMKCDASGNPTWVVALESPYVTGMAVERTADGSVYVAGSFRTKLIIGNDSLISGSPNNAFIVKFSGAGVLQWMRHFPGNPSDNGYNKMSILDLARDQSGNIYYTGFFTGMVSQGASTLNSSGTNDGFCGKMDAAGNTVWMKKFGGGYSGGCGLPNNDSGNSIALDGSGNIFIAGHFAFNFSFDGVTAPGANDIEAVVIKLNNAGNPQWARSVPGLGVQTATTVATDPWGNAVVSARFQIQCYIEGDTLYSYSQSGSPYDMLMVKYTATGSVSWYRQEGFTAGGDYPEAIACDNTGNIYVCGKFTGTTQMGDTSLSSSPSWADRIFIVSYSVSGNPHYALQCGGERNFAHALTLNHNNDLVLAGSADIGSTTGINFGPFSCPGSYGHYPYIVTLDNPFTGINPAGEPQVHIEIFPNPSSGKIHLRTDADVLATEIYSLSGWLVFFMQGCGRSFTFDPKLPVGIYMLKLNLPGGIYSRKIAVVK